MHFNLFITVKVNIKLIFNCVNFDGKEFTSDLF